MKKNLTRLLLLIITLLPVTVLADFFPYDLTSAIDQSNPGVAYLPIKVSGDSNHESTDNGLKCEVTNGLTCVIEPLAGYKFDEDGAIVKNDGNNITGTFARMVIKNNTESNITGYVSLKSDGDNTHGSPIAVTVKGQKALSSDSTLSELKSAEGTLSPNFSKDVLDYTLYNVTANGYFKISYNCDNCEVTATGGQQNRKSSAEGYSGAWEFRLYSGENKLELKVKSQKGDSTTIYKINAILGDTGYGSSKLKSLEFDGFDLDPKFDKDTLEYKLSISKKVSNLTKQLKYEAEDSGAKVEVAGADSLDNDEGEITITVTSRTDEKTIYKIKVTKDLVDSVIDVIGYKDKKVTFIDTEGTSQTLDEEEFKTKYPDEWKKIEDGTYKFDEDGNIIKEKNEENNENKDEKKKSFPWVIVILIVVGIAIIGVSGYFIFRDPSKSKKKKKKGAKDEEEVPEVSEEEKEELNDIDTYNEEARLIAEDNIRNDTKTPEEETAELIEEATKEEVVEEDEEKSPTMDIDEALSDLMNTKEYDFKDK